jgi:hypothetical protein
MAFGGIALSYLLFVLLHVSQFILAVTVCALYGIDLDRARKAGVHADGRWVYAEVVGGLSALTAVLLCVPYILRFALVWAWNLILFILWIALFGIFGKACSPWELEAWLVADRFAHRCTSTKTRKETGTSRG